MNLPRARSGVILQSQQHDHFLVDTDGGDVFQVNETAIVIFEHCRDGATAEELVLALSKRFSAPGQETEILADVEETVQTLQSLGLCEAAREP